MKAKRRSPVRGPLLTFALMIGSVGLVVAAARYLDSHQNAAGPTVAASASTDASRPNTGQ
ncbi:MAG TPA: hypothetical protein VMQ45_03310 [Burkholderiaceae bacterium]|nr:hypothetical protein [Burkholderiaceae bacterium]